MKKSTLLMIVILSIVITACAASPTGELMIVSSETPVQILKTETSIPTTTKVPTLAPTATEIPEATPTRTPVPVEVQESVISAYKVLLLIQINANMLDQIATQVKSGELSGFNSLGAVLALAQLVNSVETAIPLITPPDLLKASWDEMLISHAATKDLVKKWFNKEIDSTAVLLETSTLLPQVSKTMDALDRDLALTYGFDANEIQSQREAAVKSINAVFATPTPVADGQPEVQESLLKIISQQQYMDGNRYVIIGEVKNDSSQSMEFVKIVATLYDDQGKMIGTDFAYSVLDTIPADGKSPFKISTDEWTGTASFKLQVEGRETASTSQELQLPSHQGFVKRDRYIILGEVQNASSQPMEFVKLVATLYDDQENVVGFVDGYTEVDVIPVSGKVPFEISTDHWQTATHYEIQVQGRYGVLPRQDLVIVSHLSSKSGSRLSIKGEIKNTGDNPAEFVKLIATLYDSQNMVVGIVTTYTELSTIPAGETSPFEGSTDYFPNFDHYEIQIQGR